MTPQAAIRLTLDMSDFILKGYLDDLSDADLLVRPVPGMNHLAWQVGHLIASERTFMEALRPGSSPPLPDGFAEAHSKERAASDVASQFATKTEYLRLWDAQRGATKAVLDAVPDEDLDKPGPEQFRPYAPTVGAVLNMTGAHTLMHVGQFVAVRRRLGKPITM